jgi:hypothetical protein
MSIVSFIKITLWRSMNEAPLRDMQPPNAGGSADCGRARQVTLYTNFASKKHLKNGAVAIRLQLLVSPPWPGPDKLLQKR